MTVKTDVVVVVMQNVDCCALGVNHFVCVGSRKSCVVYGVRLTACYASSRRLAWI